MSEAADTQNELVKSLAGSLADAKFWMQLVGVMMIIYGVLTAITIIGIIVAWLPIWMGVLLFQAASAVGDARSSGDRAVMERSLSKLRVYFIIMGVLTLIGLILGVAGFLIGGMGAMMGLSGMAPAGG